MPIIQLTDIVARTAKPAAGKQLMYWDRTLANFGLRVGGLADVDDGERGAVAANGNVHVVSLDEDVARAVELWIRRFLGDKHRVGGVGDIDDGEGRFPRVRDIGVVALDENTACAEERIPGGPQFLRDEDGIVGVGDVEDRKGPTLAIRYIRLVADDEDIYRTGQGRAGLGAALFGKKCEGHHGPEVGGKERDRPPVR